MLLTSSRLHSSNSCSSPSNDMSSLRRKSYSWITCERPYDVFGIVIILMCITWCRKTMENKPASILLNSQVPNKSTQIKYSFVGIITVIIRVTLRPPILIRKKLAQYSNWALVWLNWPNCNYSNSFKPAQICILVVERNRKRRDTCVLLVARRAMPI